MKGFVPSGMTNQHPLPGLRTLNYQQGEGSIDEEEFTAAARRQARLGIAAQMSQQTDSTRSPGATVPPPLTPGASSVALASFCQKAAGS